MTLRNDDGAAIDRVSLARFALDAGQPQRALDQLASAGDAAATDPTAHVIRAAALIQLDRYRDAAIAAERGLALAPDNVALLDRLAIARHAYGDRPGAERAYLDALRLEPEASSLLSRYALLVAQEGQLEKAERLVAEASRLDPGSSTLRYVMAVIAYLRGNDDAATRTSLEILSRDPEFIGAHSFLGLLASERGDIRSAERAFVRSASLDPSDDQLVVQAREARLLTHPSMWPLRPLIRFGPAKVWIAAVVTIVGLEVAGLEDVAVVLALLYVAFVLYSWIAPPVVRRWLRRRR